MPMLKDIVEYKLNTTDHYREEGFEFFNMNILKFAYDDSIPVLERINYINIVLNNYLEHYGRSMNSLLTWMQYEMISDFTKLAERINATFMSIDTSALTKFHSDMPALFDTEESLKDQPVIENFSALKYARKEDTKNLIFDGIKYIPVTFIRDFSVNYEIQEVGVWSKEYINDMVYKMEHSYIPLVAAWVNPNITQNDLSCVKEYILKLGYYPVFLNVDLLNCVNYDADESETDLTYEKYPQVYTEMDYMNQKDFCKVIRVPDESFDSIIDLYDQAIHNDNVESIYITIYRTKINLRLINTLIAGTHLGKTLNIYVELTARGDERNNIDLVNKLTQECDPKFLNLYTSYSGYKVHAKIGLIAFKNNRFICHCGTGNFNEVTAKLYRDTHIITDDPTIVNDAYNCFKAIATKNPNTRLKLKKILKKEIRREIQKGTSGRIYLKCNHIADCEIVSLLKLAKTRGCEVTVLPRSTYGYSPEDLGKWEFRGGRFLEHERFYIFGKGKKSRIYMSSSDILFRNLYKRMEFTFKLPKYIDVEQFIQY